MPFIKNLTGAKKISLENTTGIGTAKFDLYKSENGTANPRMLLLVAHGFQLTPVGTEPTSQSGILTFGYYVALGQALNRAKDTSWLIDGAKKYASAPLAFATAGIPKMFIGAHAYDPNEPQSEKNLSAVLPTCDVLVFTGFDVSAKALKERPDGQHLNGAQSTELSDFLTGGSTPFLLTHGYKNILMHTCRSPWNTTKCVKGVEAYPTNLYAYDDGFKISLE